MLTQRFGRNTEVTLADGGSVVYTGNGVTCTYRTVPVAIDLLGKLIDQETAERKHWWTPRYTQRANSTVDPEEYKVWVDVFKWLNHNRLHALEWTATGGGTRPRPCHY